jgi:hypothetical protein
MTTLSKADLDELKRAKAMLENPGLAAKLSSILGSPLEKGMKMLPAPVQNAVHKATKAALMKALEAAVRSLGEIPGTNSRNRLHQMVAAATGAAGGVFGISALAIELPISTAVILRSIAAIAAAEGENPRQIETKLECLQVFGLGAGDAKAKGARDGDGNPSESAYFAARTAMAKAVSEAAAHLAKKGLTKASAPALVRLVALIGSRFGIVVSQKAAAQMIPILGAAGGATINALFIEHYQQMAMGHFIVRRLEKIHGAEPVRLAYEKL